METSLESLEGNRVKLSVEVGEVEFEEAVDAAFRRIAREVRVPGFRPGRAPRKILEARLGDGVAREEALREALPEYYARAVRDHEVDAIAAPEIDITEGQESGPIAFDAVVEIRPRVSIPGYDSLRVTIPSPEPTDDEIEDQLERLRAQFGELQTVERAAAAGDHVLVDIQGSQAGEPLEGLTADDYLYEVGSASIVSEIDDHLNGAKVGDILQFDAAHPIPGEGDIAFRILVKEVKQNLLPDLDDEFANEASEFETLDELRDDLVERLTTTRKVQAQLALREGTADALAQLVDEEPPEALIEAEMHHRLQDLALRLRAQDTTLEQYLEASGRSAEEIAGELREASVPAVRVDLALRAVADAEAIEAGDEAVEQELAALARRLDQDPAHVREEFERADRIPAVRSDIRKRKALEWLLDRVEIVDEEGGAIDRSSLELPSESDADTDDQEVGEDRTAETVEAEGTGTEDDE